MRLRRAAAWLLLAVALLAAPQVADWLPGARREALVKEESTFAGVLRLWSAEGFIPGAGSLSGWLLQCIRRFERAHPGVYVQLRSVSPAVIKQFASGTLNPPDAILFGQGMLQDASHLTPLRGVSLRTDLAHGRRSAMSIDCKWMREENILHTGYKCPPGRRGSVRLLGV